MFHVEQFRLQKLLTRGYFLATKPKSRDARSPGTYGRPHLHAAYRGKPPVRTEPTLPLRSIEHRLEAYAPLAFRTVEQSLKPDVPRKKTRARRVRPRFA